MLVDTRKGLFRIQPGEPLNRSLRAVSWLTPPIPAQSGVWFAGGSPQGLFEASTVVTRGIPSTSTRATRNTCISACRRVERSGPPTVARHGLTQLRLLSGVPPEYRRSAAVPVLRSSYTPVTPKPGGSSQWTAPTSGHEPAPTVARGLPLERWRRVMGAPGRRADRQDEVGQHLTNVPVSTEGLDLPLGLGQLVERAEQQSTCSQRHRPEVHGGRATFAVPAARVWATTTADSVPRRPGPETDQSGQPRPWRSRTEQLPGAPPLRPARVTAHTPERHLAPTTRQLPR